MSDLYSELVKVLPLPDPFLEVLQPPLEELGYEVKLSQAFDDVEGVKLHHHRVGANGRSVALLHVMKDVIQDPSGRFLINSLVDYFIDDVIGVYCFSETNEISELYDGQANRWMNQHPNIEAARFLRLEVIDRLKKLEPDGRPAFLNNRLILSRLFPIITAPLAIGEGRSGPPFEPYPMKAEVLQGLLDDTPTFLDVGTLQGAMLNVNSVCLIKINNESAGTGFLVGKDLVLTNHHVMSSEFRDSEEQIRKNARLTTLHFGYISPVKGETKNEEVFKLHPERLIEAKSVELDFALLRVEPAIKDAKDLKRVKFAGQPATERKKLHMLQHPKGQTMQLALSGNAVTRVSEDGTRLEYVTSAAKGSSGSPCFNEEWEVTALHRAEVTSRIGPFAWGTVRQGVPFKSIYETIRPYLEVETSNEDEP
jgi:V8-like Glu-specific endopeptidase